MEQTNRDQAAIYKANDFISKANLIENMEKFGKGKN